MYAKVTSKNFLFVLNASLGEVFALRRCIIVELCKQKEVFEHNNFLLYCDLKAVAKSCWECA